jgi:hypothetical protein
MSKNKTIQNPVSGLIGPLDLDAEQAKIIPIPGTDAHLSVIPEYLSESTALYFYGVDTVLTLNCAIIRPGVENVYLEFVDEKDFYSFMEVFKDNQDKYRPTTIRSKTVRYLKEYNERNY